jgi:hypothetical protein
VLDFQGGADHRAGLAAGVDGLLGHLHLGRGQPDLVLQRAERAVVGVGAALLVGGDRQVAELVGEELDAVRVA